jgi:hypothetical protein
MSLSWTQPTCERCWIAEHTRADGDGIAIDIPVRVKDAGPDVCSYCGFITISGIYTRADPSTVKYPKEKE